MSKEPEPLNGENELDFFESYVQRAANKMSDFQLEIWEHAALLYHEYEWQAAASTFKSLSNQMQTQSKDGLRRSNSDNKEGSILCLVNAGLIEGRLGDYRIALSTLRTADQTGAKFPLTRFLIGLIEFYMGNLVAAEYNFDLCLRRLQGWRSATLKLSHTFELDTLLVQTNLQIIGTIRAARRNGKSSTDSLLQLIAVPAEFIIEPPPKSCEQNSVSTVVGHETPTSTTRLNVKTPSLNLKGFFHLHYSPKTTGQRLQSRLASSIKSRLSKSILRESKAPRLGQSLLKDIDPPGSSESRQITSTASSGVAKSALLQPRPARADPTSTAELAKFLVLYAPDDTLEPRDEDCAIDDTEEITCNTKHQRGKSKSPLTDAENRWASNNHTVDQTKNAKRANNPSLEHCINSDRLSLHPIEPQRMVSPLAPGLDNSSTSTPTSGTIPPAIPRNQQPMVLQYLKPTVYVRQTRKDCHDDNKNTVSKEDLKERENKF